MTRKGQRLLVAGFLALLTAAFGAHRAAKPAREPAVLQGLVTSVRDGDTLVVLDEAKAEHRIRLLGVDAPEGGQPFGKVARQALRERTIGKPVRVLVQSRDRYGRAVGKLLLDGADINLELVRGGLAWHYVHYANDQFPGDAARYAAAEREARKAKRGLWIQPAPEAPWEWRKDHRRP